MRISVQMIVYNCEEIMPKGMMSACVQSIYPHVDEIIIVEGATSGMGKYWDGDATWMTKTGKSGSETIDALFSIPDPKNKLKIYAGHGWWNGKTEQCNHASARATGDYIFQIDADEFYHEKDIPKIIDILEKDRPDAVHFYANHFWGGFDHCIDEYTGSGWGNDIAWKRIFRNEKGSKWLSHEPPEYVLADGRKCNEGKVIHRGETLSKGIKLYHYGYCVESQAKFKQRFYKNNDYMRLWSEWNKDHSVPLIAGATTNLFTGEHPEKVRELINRKNQYANV